MTRTTPPSLTLFQRDDCHLCDAALDVLCRAGVSDFDSCFIDQDAALEQAYGQRVPVLRCTEDGRELDWPFDPTGVNDWLSARSA